MKKIMKRFLLFPIFILLLFAAEATKAIFICLFSNDNSKRRAIEELLNYYLKTFKEYFELIPALWGTSRYLANQTIDEGGERRKAIS
jgi:hypothetical protein